jgi:hypothetical protein
VSRALEPRVAEPDSADAPVLTGEVQDLEPVAPVTPAVQAVAVVATTFVAGVATVAAVRHARVNGVPRPRLRRRANRVRVLGTRSFLVDVHLVQRR